jgi:hypothetical protein
MNVFSFRDRLISDYASFISSFIRIQNPKIQQYVRGGDYEMNPSYSAHSSC